MYINENFSAILGCEGKQLLTVLLSKRINNIQNFSNCPFFSVKRVVIQLKLEKPGVWPPIS